MKVTASFKVSSRKARIPLSLPVCFTARHEEREEACIASYASALWFGLVIKRS